MFCLFVSIQKEAEEAENEQVVRKKKSHLIEDLKVGKKVLDNFEVLKVGKQVLDNFEDLKVGKTLLNNFEDLKVGKTVLDNLTNFLHQIVLLTAKLSFWPGPTTQPEEVIE